MSEVTDYNNMRKYMKQPLDRLTRIENVVGVGTPDVNYCIEGTEGWIELKSPLEPKRDRTPLLKSQHKVSQEQKNFMLSQFNAGGNGYVLICTDKRWVLMGGGLADGLNEMTVQQLIDNCQWTSEKPIRKTQWYNLRNILMGNIL